MLLLNVAAAYLYPPTWCLDWEEYHLYTYSCLYCRQVLWCCVVQAVWQPLLHMFTASNSWPLCLTSSQHYKPGQVCSSSHKVWCLMCVKWQKPTKFDSTCRGACIIRVPSVMAPTTLPGSPSYIAVRGGTVAYCWMLPSVGKPLHSQGSFSYSAPRSFLPGGCFWSRLLCCTNLPLGGTV